VHAWTGDADNVGCFAGRCDRRVVPDHHRRS
jgi:hypothetical protein